MSACIVAFLIGAATSASLGFVVGYATGTREYRIRLRGKGQKLGVVRGGKG